MPLAHDVVLRKGLDEWIRNWRKYAVLHPDAKEDQEWREVKYKEMVALLDARQHLQDSITCPRCQKVSFNRRDIEEKYCGYCHRFHEAL